MTSVWSREVVADDQVGTLPFRWLAQHLIAGSHVLSHDIAAERHSVITSRITPDVPMHIPGPDVKIGLACALSVSEEAIQGLLKIILIRRHDRADVSLSYKATSEIVVGLLLDTHPLVWFNKDGRRIPLLLRQCSLPFPGFRAIPRLRSLAGRGRLR